MVSIRTVIVLVGYSYIGTSCGFVVGTLYLALLPHAGGARTHAYCYSRGEFFDVQMVAPACGASQVTRKKNCRCRRVFF